MRSLTGLVLLTVALVFVVGCNTETNLCLTEGDWGACVEHCEQKGEQRSCAKLKTVGMEDCLRGNKERCHHLCDKYKMEPACEMAKIKSN